MKAKIKNKGFMEDSGTGGKRSNPTLPDKNRNPSAQKKVGFMEDTVKDGKRSNPK